MGSLVVTKRQQLPGMKDVLHCRLWKVSAAAFQGVLLCCIGYVVLHFALGPFGSVIVGAPPARMKHVVVISHDWSVYCYAPVRANGSRYLHCFCAVCLGLIWS